MKYSVLIGFFLILTGTTFGQPIALKRFLNTDLIHQFDSIRKEAEKEVLDFKAVQHEYDPEVANALAKKYDSAAGLFNNVLLGIKADLEDKRERKFIRQYPDKYAEEVEQDLERAKAKYEEFLDMYAEYKDGFCIPCIIKIIVPIYSYLQSGFQIFQEFKMKAKDFNEGMLNRYLIDSHRFKLWEEI